MQKNNILFEISSKATTFVIMAIIVATLAGCTKKDDEIVLNPENTYYLENETENVVYTDTADVTNAVSADNEQDEDALEKTSSIFVYVCGAVLHEGVYELESGSRVIDAINAAGGFDIEADTSYVNQAAELTDGLKIRIPKISETEALSETGTGVEVFSEAISPENGDGSGSHKKDGRININTASIDELCELPGIGNGYAQRIIAYREENGSFRAVEDIMNVKGIKEKLFSQIKEYIVV